MVIDRILIGNRDSSAGNTQSAGGVMIMVALQTVGRRKSSYSSSKVCFADVEVYKGLLDGDVFFDSVQFSL